MAASAPSSPRRGRAIFWGLHAVEHALRSGRYRGEELYLSIDRRADPLRMLAQSEGLATHQVSALQLKKLEPRARQALLFCRPLAGEPSTLRQIVAQEEAQEHSLILLCDGITDLHNIGAIIRSAYHFRVAAVVLASHHTPRDWAQIAYASTGSCFHLSLIPHQNIANSLRMLQEHNYWVIGADMMGESLQQVSLTYSHVALVVGDEERGIRQLTRTHCDKIISIPGDNRESLNVSVATAILLYELRRPHL